MSSEPAAKRRRSHAAANDEVLHDASLRLLAEHGVDGVSFSELAQAAGLTRAPIYARYDSPEDVAAELWTSTLAPQFDRLLEMTAEWYSGSDDTPSKKYLAELNAPSRETTAMIEVLAVARRFPYLDDLVGRFVADRIASYTASFDVPRAVAVSHLSVLLGTLMLAPVVGPTMKDGWKLSMPVARELFSDEEAWAVPPRVVKPVELPIAAPQFGDDILDSFVPAIIRVISRSGYEHASANRISRETGRAFNAVYERFSNKDALMEVAVSAWVQDGVNLAFTPFVGITADEYIDRSVTQGRSLVADMNRPFRNLRNEMTLAARHHRSIARNMAKLYLDAAQGGRAVFESFYDGMTDETFLQVGIIGSLVRSNGFGLCLMASCTGSLADVEWTPASTALQRLIERRVVSKLQLRKN